MEPVRFAKTKARKIKKKLNDGSLVRVARGVYVSKPVSDVERCALAHPNAVFTLLSSLSLRGLTDYFPVVPYFLSYKRGNRVSPNKDIVQFWNEEPLFSLGLEEIKYEGYSFRTYDLEKTLIETFRFEKKLGVEYYKEIIRTYRTLVRTPKFSLVRFKQYCSIYKWGDTYLWRLKKEVM
jgi:predicted transcriptional regulator of viral defense system